MDFVSWKPEFSVGVASIDAQHKHIIGLINKLQTALQDKVPKPELYKFFLELNEYALTHFAYEESLFDKVSYQFSEEHKKEHQALLKKTKEIQSNFEQGKSLVALQFLSFLYDWLWQHIQHSDKKYSRLFKQNGIV